MTWAVFSAEYEKEATLLNSDADQVSTAFPLLGMMEEESQVGLMELTPLYTYHNNRSHNHMIRPHYWLLQLTSTPFVSYHNVEAV